MCGSGGSRCLFRIHYQVLPMCYYLCDNWVLLLICYKINFHLYWHLFSIVNNDEFSARLSVASIMRLQAAALRALSEDGTVDITTIFKLAHHFTSLSVCQKSMNDGESSVNSLTAMSSCTNEINHSQLENGTTGLFFEYSVWIHASFNHVVFS